MLHKLLFFSILVADIAIPIWASRHPDARQAFKKMLMGVLFFNVFYFVALFFFGA